MRIVEGSSVGNAWAELMCEWASRLKPIGLGLFLTTLVAAGCGRKESDRQEQPAEEAAVSADPTEAALLEKLRQMEVLTSHRNRQVSGEAKVGGWVTYRHAGGDFQIDLPETPIAPPPEIRERALLRGSYGDSYKCEIRYLNAFDEMLKKSNETEAVEYLIRDFAGKPKSSRRIELGKFQGAEIQYTEGPEQFVWMRSYLVNRKIVVISLTLGTEEMPEGVRRFFDSFKVLLPWEDSTAALRPYAERRQGFQTDLIKKGSAPDQEPPESAPEGVKEVSYPSGSLNLKAWVVSPPGPGPFPALIYCHGGYMLGSSDVEDVQPFVKAGLLVMLPAWRGENGNAGNHELWMGEVDDAEAAIRWLASQPNVNKDQVFAFGHSLGGGMTDLLSLRDVPLVHSGSSGGLYETDVFEKEWYDQIPFNRTRRNEEELRVLMGNQRDMRRPHWAFLGKGDFTTIFTIKEAASEAAALREPRLTTVSIKGDHFTSLPEAIQKYLEIVQSATTGKN